MNKIFSYILNHKIQTCLLAFFLPLTIVHFLFKFNSGYYFISAEWSAGDLIGYISGFLAFLGTSLLAAVAHKQNEDHNKTKVNSEAANTFTPFFVIQEVIPPKEAKEGVAQFVTSHYEVNQAKAKVVLKNIGCGIAVNVSYKTGFGRKIRPEDTEINLNININESFEIDISANNKLEGEVIRKDIEYQNILGFKYKQTLTYKFKKVPEQTSECDWEETDFLYIYLLGKQERIGFDKGFIDGNSNKTYKI